MRLFWQKEWFNIKFKSFTFLDSKHIADEKFYDLFYDTFYKKYNSYESLPNSWKESKSALAKYIYKQIKNKKSVLSIGCGNGYIENEIVNMPWDGKLLAIEPSTKAVKWLNSIEVISGYFPDVLKNKDTYDFAYMCYIDYAFDNESYLKLIKDIKIFSIDEFLLLGASIYTPSFLSNLKYLIKYILINSGICKQQLWGYQRTIKEHIEIFKKAGFEDVKYGQLEDGVYWIRVKNGQN